MALNLWTASIRLVARDDASRQLMSFSGAAQQAGQAATHLNSSLRQLAGAFTAVMAARYVARGLTALVKPAMDVQMVMRRLQTLVRENTEGMEKFYKAAKEAARVTPYGPKETLESMLRLRQATGSSEAAIKNLHATLGLAMASFGKVTPEGAAIMMGDIIKGFGMTGDAAEIAADKVYAGARGMGIQIQDLSKIMGKLGMAATAGGQSFDAMLKSMLLARRTMPSSERAATEIIRLATELGSPKTRAGLGQLGIEVTDVTGRVRDMSLIMLEMANRYEESPVLVRNVIRESMGTAAAKPVLAMLGSLSKGIVDNEGKVRKGVQAYQFLNETLRESGGSIKQAQEEYLQTAGAQVEVLRENFYTLAVALGNKLLPMLDKLARTLSPIVSALTALVEHPIYGTMIKWALVIGTVSAAAWALKAALWGVGRIAANVTANIREWSLFAGAAGAGGAGASAAAGGTGAAVAAAAGASAAAAGGLAAATSPAALAAAAAMGASASRSAASQGARGGIPQGFPVNVQALLAGQARAAGWSIPVSQAARQEAAGRASLWQASRQQQMAALEAQREAAVLSRYPIPAAWSPGPMAPMVPPPMAPPIAGMAPLQLGRRLTQTPWQVAPPPQGSIGAMLSQAQGAMQGLGSAALAAGKAIIPVFIVGAAAEVLMRMTGKMSAYDEERRAKALADVRARSLAAGKLIYTPQYYVEKYTAEATFGDKGRKALAEGIARIQTELYERQKETARDIWEGFKAMGRDLVSHFKDAYGYLQMGTKEMDNVLNKWKGLFGYEPPTPEAKYEQRYYRQMTRAKGAAGARIARMVATGKYGGFGEAMANLQQLTGGVGAMEAVRGTLAEAHRAGRPLTPEQRETILRQMGMAYIAGVDIAQREPGLGITREGYRGFGGKYATPWAQSGPEGLLYAEGLLGVRGGKSPMTGARPISSQWLGRIGGIIPDMPAVLAEAIGLAGRLRGEPGSEAYLPQEGSSWEAIQAIGGGRPKALAAVGGAALGTALAPVLSQLIPLLAKWVQNPEVRVTNIKEGDPIAGSQTQE
ncbi:MAG: phage tail tape measure protein [Deltaproteobacteria bacterium]|nr:phage tail tape measure protein [Deltaproteobacteria bacterium]